jgi:hypothetical protein
MPKTKRETTEADFVHCEACDEQFGETPVMHHKSVIRTVSKDGAGSGLPWGTRQAPGRYCPHGHLIEEAK